MHSICDLKTLHFLSYQSDGEAANESNAAINVDILTSNGDKKPQKVLVDVQKLINWLSAK